MLFDLRSAGRRRVIKVIYIMLAVVMAGGLIFFGVGSNQQGGLFDAINPFSSGNGSSGNSQIETQIKELEEKVKANPDKAQDWAQLAALRVQAAQAVGNFDSDSGNVTFSDKSRERLEEAGQAWQRYLALKPKNRDAAIAAQMVLAYGPEGINSPIKAFEAQQIVTNARPTFASYGTLALFAYGADKMKAGDRAAKKAVELAPKNQKEQIKTQLDQIKAQAVLRKAQENEQIPPPAAN